MGRAWVGKGYTIASDGKTLVSADKMRIFRPPSNKNSSFATTGVQANFEQIEMVKYVSNQGDVSWKRKVLGNGHLNILD